MRDCITVDPHDAALIQNGHMKLVFTRGTRALAQSRVIGELSLVLNTDLANDCGDSDT